MAAGSGAAGIEPVVALQQSYFSVQPVAKKLATPRGHSHNVVTRVFRVTRL